MSSSLFKWATEVTNRLPFTSEEHHHRVMGLLRDAETEVRGDSIDAESPPVVPPAPGVFVNPDAPVAVASTGQPIDYDALADAIYRRQQAAELQQKQAAAAVEAAPDFEPPGAETAPAAETHAAIQAG